MILDARGRPTKAAPGQVSIGDLIKKLRRELGHMPNKQKTLTLEAIAALTQLSLRLYQAEQPRPVVLAQEAHALTR